jgi:hypothetical protein
VRPLAVKIIPLGPQQCHAWLRPRTGATTAQILLHVSRRRLRAPNKGLPGNEGHQGKDVSGTTHRQPKSCRAHISTPPPTTIQPRTPPGPTQPCVSAPPRGTSRTTPTPASASTKPTPPKSPQAPKQEDFADQPYRGVIHMITRGSSVDFDTKRQKRDHYRCVNHVAITGLVVQTKWSHVPLTFDARDVDLRSAPHIDAMVINCSVAGWDLHKVLVDNGS